MIHNTECDLFRKTLKKYMDDVNRPFYGIEIGCLNGETSRFLLNLDDRIHLYGIDTLLPDPVEPSLRGSEELIRAHTEEFDTRWQFIKWYSYRAAEWFNDESIDFIFVDGSHLYQDVLKDFELYRPKLMLGGLMYFHDSRMYRGGPEFWEGPSKFVEALITTNNSVKLIDEAYTTTVFERVW